MYRKRNTNVLKKNSASKTEISIDEPLNTDWDGNELLLSDILGTDNDVVNRNIEEEVDRDLLRIAMSRLSKREMTIMKMRFGLDNTEEKRKRKSRICWAFPQSYISRLEKRIIARLKRDITKMIE